MTECMLKTICKAFAYIKYNFSYKVSQHYTALFIKPYKLADNEATLLHGSHEFSET